MPDRLFLSLRFPDFSERTMLRHYEQLVRLFPFSRLSRGYSTVRVHAVSQNEPALFEQPFPNPLNPDAVVAVVGGFAAADCAIFLDTQWDLFQYDQEWRLKPAAVCLACFLPLFEDSEGEQIRLDLGRVDLFLPDPDVAHSVQAVQANLQSLVHLAKTVERSLKPVSRRLWTESGVDLARHLEEFESAV
jgi:hypothetical protein